MNELQTFSNAEFGEIRSITIENIPYFVGRDVASILGYANTRDALAKRVDSEDKLTGVAICDTNGRETKPVLINESGLYSLILTSKLPSAKEFKRWVTSSVLPMIRKTGVYSAGMSLFEDQTYENLLANAMARVSSTFDKREGSMVYNGVAPSMAELAQLYIGLDFVFTATYIATAPRDYLIERAKDRGLSPKAASAAVFRAEFNIEVPVGSRFSCEELNFIVTERMTGEDTETGLSHKVTCETAGSAANDCAGDLIPIEYIAGLTTAKLVELLIPGDDEEDTEVFRQRILDAVQSQAFGGNQADYKAKVLGIDGVAAVKVHPVWNADRPPGLSRPQRLKLGTRVSLTPLRTKMPRRGLQAFTRQPSTKS